MAGAMKGVKLGPSFFIPFGEVRVLIVERGCWLRGNGWSKWHVWQAWVMKGVELGPSFLHPFGGGEMFDG